MNKIKVCNYKQKTFLQWHILQALSADCIQFAEVQILLVKKTLSIYVELTKQSRVSTIKYDSKLRTAINFPKHNRYRRVLV